MHRMHRRPIPGDWLSRKFRSERRGHWIQPFQASTEMSALKEAATIMWTKLVEAMRADGIIAHRIEQSGPATTSVIVDACQAVLGREYDGTWLPMTIHPDIGREVVAATIDGKLVAPLTINKYGTWYHNGKRVAVRFYSKWTYVKPPFVAEENGNDQ